MGPAACVYELRDGAEVVATGRLSLDAVPAEGETLRVGGRAARVETVTPSAGGELHLVLQLRA
jgi:hypothetical protein